MKKEIADKWANELESNNYEQGKGCLRDGDSYCCLGVLCDLVKKEIGGDWIESQIPSSYKFAFKGERDFLPVEVMYHCDMKYCNPIITIERNDEAYDFTDEGRITLSDLNDKHFSFPKIAQLIRKNYEIL